MLFNRSFSNFKIFGKRFSVKMFRYNMYNILLI